MSSSESGEDRFEARLGPVSRYAELARVLAEEIRAGRYPVGSKIPTEAELQQRFATSRHTVRAALKALKEQGLLLATPGVGTVVRAATSARRSMQGAATLRELIQLAEATRMVLVARRDRIVEVPEAGPLGFRAGQQVLELTILRFVPDNPVPTGHVVIYLRPEHSAIADQVEASPLPVHAMVEQRYGTRIAEVRQRIVPVMLDSVVATQLRAPPDSLGLQITRQFVDEQDRPLVVSVGTYPQDRFSHDMVFRVQPETP